MVQAYALTQHSQAANCRSGPVAHRYFSGFGLPDGREECLYLRSITFPRKPARSLADDRSPNGNPLKVFGAGPQAGSEGLDALPARSPAPNGAVGQIAD